MPSKKKKYNARFPAGRIKKIMQSDEEIGKVAQAVPVIISRTLELFVESLLSKTLKITNARHAKTLSPSHLKQCIMSEPRFDFLRELVKKIPDISMAEEAAFEEEAESSPEVQYPDSDTPFDLSMPSTSTQAANRKTKSHTNGGDNNDTIACSSGSRLVSSNGNSLSSSVNEQQRILLKREAEFSRHMGVTVPNMNSSVIKHTSSLSQVTSVDCLPPKLTRSESTPTSQDNWALNIGSHHLQHRQRLKHQSKSMPHNNNKHIPATITSAEAAAASTAENNNNIFEPNKSFHQIQPPAIPAPTVNLDFCYKPVVKIDYSKLNPLAPLSAPANIATTSQNTTTSTFDFSVNIDLSNIAVTPTSIPTTKNDSTAMISITPLPQTMNIPTLATSSPIENEAASKQNNRSNDHTINSKANMAAPSKMLSPTPKATLTVNHHLNSAAKLANMPLHSHPFKTASNTNKNTFLELDEDYDNI